LAAQESETPRIRVAALLTYHDAIVLVRHRKGDATYHLLPGGGVQRGETLVEALTREVAEETGLAVDVGDLVVANDTIAPDGSRHVVNLTFRADIVGGSIATEPVDDRVESVELVEPERLKGLDFRPPIAGPVLAALQGRLDGQIYVGSVFSAE
jgi:8-oxo-dGTP diphosphatase